jgi:hypothetical protein
MTGKGKLTRILEHSLHSIDKSTSNNLKFSYQIKGWGIVVFRFFDLFNEGQKEKLVQYKSFHSGDFLIVRVKEFYQKSNISLTTDIDNVCRLKQRPIIIIRDNNGTISFIATSTNMFFKHRRPKINLSKCFFQKRTKEECLDLDIKDEVFLFTKDGKRFKFYINPQVLIDLYKEGNLIECGNCSMIIPLIEKLIGGAG